MPELWIWRQRGHRVWQALAGGERWDPTSKKPLFFFHIPKTGGSSFVSMIRAMIPWRLAVAEKRHDISARFVEKLVADGLKHGLFIYGHPGPGAALPVRGKTSMSVLVREPAAHAISNYLWVRRRKDLPDHPVAKSLGFREFLLVRPYFAIFQTGSLHVGIQQTSLGRAEDLIERLPGLLDYLSEFDIVGTTANLPDFFLRNCALMGLGAPPSVPHFLNAGISKDERRSMREQYHELQRHPKLGPLLAAEQELYRHAQAIEMSLETQAAQSAAAILPLPAKQRRV